MVKFIQPIDQVKSKKFVSSTRSVTRQEIESFWRRKRNEEEDHLLAAIKAAARIRARNFTEEDYRRFEESLTEARKIRLGHDHGGNDDDEASLDEIRVGIKDWWTKSKYAYLNEPPMEKSGFVGRSKASASYTPNKLCFYKAPSSLFPSSIGHVF